MNVEFTPPGDLIWPEPGPQELRVLEELRFIRASPQVKRFRELMFEEKIQRVTQGVIAPTGPIDLTADEFDELFGKPGGLEWT